MRDAKDFFDREYSPILSGGLSAGAYPCSAPRWRDKRDVVVLSVKHTPAMTTVSVRTRRGRVSKEKPMAVNYCNRLMAGVDKSDQMLGYYSFTWKAVK